MKLARITRRILFAVAIMLLATYEYIKFFVGPIRGDVLLFGIVTAVIGGFVLLIESFEGKKNSERPRDDGE